MSREFRRARGVSIALQKVGGMMSFEESGKGGAAGGRKRQGTQAVPEKGVTESGSQMWTGVKRVGSSGKTGCRRGRMCGSGMKEVRFRWGDRESGRA